MPTTSNFGWTTPADTDLVKDGAAAIRTLGNGIDASLVDLKGGTTNQVLAKNSNTDLDFKWVADATGIPATIFDAKGDIIAATAADTADRLAVGTNGQVLTADSSTATGLKWGAAPASTKSFSLLNSGGTALTGASTITVSSLSGYDQFFVLVIGASANASSVFSIRFNGDTGTNYARATSELDWASTYATGNYGGYGGTSETSFFIGKMSTDGASVVNAHYWINGCNTSGVKMAMGGGSGQAGTGNSHATRFGGGIYNSSSVISSISIVNISGSNFDAGTVYIYGAA